GFYNASEKLAKAISAESAGKSEVAKKYREVADKQACSAKSYIQAAGAYVEGKMSEGASWKCEGSSFQKKADYQVKGIEAQEAGKTELAADYQEAATISQRAVDKHKLAVQIKAAGKGGEGVSWSNEGKSLQAMADYRIKAIEAQMTEKTELTAGYQEASAVSQRAADQWKESALAKAEGRESEYTRLWQSGKAMQEEADAVAKRAEGNYSANRTNS
ncbi:MAG TPA: hypothetical protein VJK54_09295, partial [Chthoniobacterales bacterium]|nr:hypothetical protein [Chthoniobacterales bacterium]